ncbi:hypothetical protein QJS04_geneDACA005290 [Acorus gramineus]|uniref:Uncharacterized protein n=1 Tax=Acorus gramineus TaxID=55184 RepID=A0AAV9AVW6_ACOGR|nr:hypothetical protein QJS04_geneDACA005290 [Acorus gramineus]
MLGSTNWVPRRPTPAKEWRIGDAGGGGDEDGVAWVDVADHADGVADEEALAGADGVGDEDGMTAEDGVRDQQCFIGCN